MLIKFTEALEDQKLLLAIYLGWIRGGELQGKHQLMIGNDVTRKLMELLVEDGRAMKARPGGGELDLQPREFQLLRAHCEAASFPPAMSAEALRMFEVFEDTAEDGRLTLHDRPA